MKTCFALPCRISKTQSAFTLVELLVVLAILLIVASMLLPVLAKGRDGSERVNCVNNLRQIGLALNMYSQETGYYPGHYRKDETDIFNSIVVWPGRLLHYAGKSRDVFFCPSNDKKFRWSDGTNATTLEAFPFNLTGRSGFSYGYNDWGGARQGTQPYNGLGAWVDDPDYGEIRLSAIIAPGEMIAITDSHSDFQWDTAADPIGGKKFSFEWPGKRHSGGANVLLCDNHVEFLKQEKLVAPTPEMRRRWNTDHEPHPENW